MATKAVDLFRDGKTREQIATELDIHCVRVGPVVSYGLNPFRKP